MKNNKTESKATPPAPPVTPPAPTVNPPLSGGATEKQAAPAASLADAPAPTMKEVHYLLHNATKAALRMERPFILSSWGQAEKRGEVTPRDKGALLDSKNIKELRAAAAKRGSDGQPIVDSIDRYLAGVAMEKALAAFSASLAERAHLHALSYAAEAEVAAAEKALAVAKPSGDGERIAAAEAALTSAMESLSAARAAVKASEKAA